MATVGTKLDGVDLYTDASASQQLMSTTGWTNSALTGNNSTGLNLVPTGDLFMSSATTKDYANKGVLASFWTSTTVQSSTYAYPLLFEISTATFDSNDKSVGLRGSISNTTSYGDGVTIFPAEKR